MDLSSALDYFGSEQAKLDFHQHELEIKCGKGAAHVSVGAGYFNNVDSSGRPRFASTFEVAPFSAELSQKLKTQGRDGHLSGALSSRYGVTSMKLGEAVPHLMNPQPQGQHPITPNRQKLFHKLGIPRNLTCDC